jgi:hypothetical protein
VQADPESFPFPWAQRLGSKWSSLEDSNGTTNSFLIAGQIARGPRQELPAVRSAADRRLIFAAVKCRNAWNGGDEILTAAWSAAEAAELFRVRGAKVLQPSENEQSAPRFLKRPIEAEDYLPDSRASHFLHALRHADVVHVIAHGSAEGLELSDQRATADIVGTDALRCRLLILASCSTADLAFSADAFLLPLVRRGINIVAPIAPIWDKYGSEFLLNLYEELVPVRGSAGKPFATCLASAVQRLRHRFKDHTDLARLEASVDRFMLFGNPTLYFNVVR